MTLLDRILCYLLLNFVLPLMLLSAITETELNTELYQLLVSILNLDALEFDLPIKRICLEQLLFDYGFQSFGCTCT
jgi:hypothetical protein